MVAGRRLWNGVFVVCAACVFASCTDDAPAAPSRGAIVTFRVVDETFRVQLLTAAQVDAARRAQSGSGPTIPNGRIVAGASVNAGWSWHLEDVQFADVTIELCDGRPSDVERAGVSYGGGRFCPWTARVTAIDENQ